MRICFILNTKKYKITNLFAIKLTSLKEQEEEVLVIDWHKNQRQRISLEHYIMTQLYPELKNVYDMPTFKEQSGKVYSHFLDQAVGGCFSFYYHQLKPIIS